jgi:tetraacyldisaccharide 4'-kinase
LREPLSRLNEVDLVFVNDGLTPVEWVSVKSQQKMALDKFAHTKVHAVAGIGHPERFFDLLRKMGLEVVSHVFPDHYAIGEKDLNFNDALPIVMTEKDAVKCEAFADDRYWYLAVTANIDEVFKQKLLQSLEVRDEHKDEFKKHSYDVDYSMRHGGVRE